MQKLLFQGPKRTFMHVSGLLPPSLIKKTNFQVSWFLSQNMASEDLRHA